MRATSLTARLDRTGAPSLLALHRYHPQRYPFLLESTADGAPGTAMSRYSLLLACPQAWLALRNDTLHSQGLPQPQGTDFFMALDEWVAREPAASPSTDLPFMGGWFLLLGYEVAAHLEPRLKLPSSPHTLPDALAVRCPAAIVVDHADDRYTLVSESTELLDLLRSDCRNASTIDREFVAAHAGHVTVTEESPQVFLDGVRRILEYLRAGDSFQVNLSRAWYGRSDPAMDYTDLYQRLCHNNPAPFAGLINWQGSALLSSSPERLLMVEQGTAQTRPIAGTCARLEDAAADQRQRQELQSNLKERAEHLMLIDLERNDLGRVCESGSIEVRQLMALESYQHVHHLVSTVRGRLRSNASPVAALRAVFPGGTITGCPKVRTMQIIAELEGVGRGPYTGAMGYLSRCGRLDTNILIRSMVCEGNRFTLRAGAGIVADSDPQTELEETRMKALGVLKALEGA